MGGGKNNAMKTFEKLAAKIKNELGIDATHFERVHAGYWQRASGAWSWRARSGPRDIGSQYPAKDILQAKKITLSRDGSIDPQ